MTSLSVARNRKAVCEAISPWGLGNARKTTVARNSVSCDAKAA